MEQKYDVFISYSRKDYIDENKNVIPGNVVSKIKDKLSEAGISFWFDETGINHGDNFVEKIVTHIEQSDVFLYISSANANKSNWTCKEIASADEMKKHIIPIRVDKSKYNAKVLFRIADMDYIEYYTNEEKALQELVDSIKAYLDNQETEKQQREEELQRLLQQREKEQKELILHIENSLKKSDNDKKKIELELNNLLLDIEKVLDIDKRDELTQLVKSRVDVIPGDVSQIQFENSTLKREKADLNNALTNTKKELERVKSLEEGKTNGSKKRLHIVYLTAIIILVLSLLFCLVYIGYVEEEQVYWNNRYDKMYEESLSLARKIDSLNSTLPLSRSSYSSSAKETTAKTGATIHSVKSEFNVLHNDEKQTKIQVHFTLNNLKDVDTYVIVWVFNNDGKHQTSEISDAKYDLNINNDKSVLSYAVVTPMSNSTEWKDFVLYFPNALLVSSGYFQVELREVTSTKTLLYSDKIYFTL